MKKAAQAIVWLICATGLAAQAQELRGQLYITRTLTKQRVAVPTYDVRGPAPHAKPKDTPAPNEWSRVAVYLEGAGAPAATKATAKINQVGQRFDPEVVIVPVGSTVSFPNSDPIFHNVFSLSKAKEFDLGFYPAGESRTIKFDKPGIVQVYCHLHSDMNAAILVVPNDWYIQPDNQGAFTFSNIPAGTYQVGVWHKSAGFFRREVRIPEHGTANISIEIPIDAVVTHP